MYTTPLCRSQAYTAWVNSQLRKRPELPLIEDMGNDLQDGVLVAKLIEIISKCFVSSFTSFLPSFQIQLTVLAVITVQ